MERKEKADSQNDCLRTAIYPDNATRTERLRKTNLIMTTMTMSRFCLKNSPDYV